jgi:HEAT repeat protein
MECIEKRGTEKTLDLLNQELLKIRKNKDLLEIVLPYLPKRGDFLFRRTLIDFMKDPAFPCRDVLRETMKILPTTVLIPELFSILKSDRNDYPHIVRIEALKLLGELKAPYCLQHILEHLPTLPAAEARNFASVLSSYNEDLFIERAGEILDSVDANVRSTLISSLPATGKKVFLKQIQKSLGDADPEVRIASVWSILEYKDVKSLNQTAGMLRDPVERVRKEVARVLGTHGSPASLKALQKLLEDENEVLSVKEAAITGLAYSREPKSIDILIDSFGKDAEIRDLLVDGLSEKTEKKEITRIIEQFKDASPDVRDNISRAFMKMREESEASILELLKEDIASLRPHLTEILEKTGYVESRIRQLAHRDPRVRRTAAETLAYIGTISAFRGMVLAARDPDSEVRVKVTRALEQLETDEGKTILKELENDPDKRVRKYTLWALERLRAKEL